MACKQIRFAKACHAITGINGISVSRAADGTLLPADIIYWSDGTITDPNGNAVTALPDIADYAAAQAAEQADCTSAPSVQYFPAEAPDGTDVLLTVTDGVPTGAVGLDGNPYTGALGDLDWVEDNDIEVSRRPVCFNGIDMLRVENDTLQVQGSEDDTTILSTFTYTDLDGNAVTGPTQADFDAKVASFGACRRLDKPSIQPLCGAGC